MIELVFVACLSAQPATCENRAMQFTDVSVTTCTLGAQPQLAQWVNEHPGWLIRRWTCQPLVLGRDA
jgi:hypothetical protein